MDPERIEPIVEAILAEHPEGLAEQPFLQRLREHPGSGIPAGHALAGLALFRQHFLLFHVLYRLRDRLRASGGGDIAIDPMCIRLRDCHAGAPAVGRYDALRAWYLDPANLAQTDKDDVAAMLSGFDAALRRRELRAEAMAELELTEPFDAAAARRQYRRLAMRHHPDRGGDAARLRAIHRAYRLLVPRVGE